MEPITFAPPLSSQAAKAAVLNKAVKEVASLMQTYFPEQERLRSSERILVPVPVASRLAPSDFPKHGMKIEPIQEWMNGIFQLQALTRTAGAVLTHIPKQCRVCHNTVTDIAHHLEFSDVHGGRWYHDIYHDLPMEDHELALAFRLVLAKLWAQDVPVSRTDVERLSSKPLCSVWVRLFDLCGTFPLTFRLLHWVQEVHNFRGAPVHTPLPSTLAVP